MKTKIAVLLSAMFLASSVFAATVQLPKAELSKFDWQAVDLSQKITSNITGNKQTQAFARMLTGAQGTVVGYKIPANQGTLKISLHSLVVDNDHVFVPNVLVLDANYNVSFEYPASQFKVVEERGFDGNQLQADLDLTPVAGQDFIYLLVYTTEKDLNGQTKFTHPAKLYAKAKGNQPPAIADIMVKHTNTGKIVLDVEGVQSTQFIGLAKNGPLFETKKPAPQQIGEVKSTAEEAKSVQPVEQTTEQYFNQAVTKALKNHDVNKAMNLVNEAEKLGLTSPRRIFLQQVSAK